VVLHFVLDGPTDAGPGDSVLLTGAEAHHASAVRRVRGGESVTVGDGRGAWLTGHVKSAGAREVVILVDTRVDVPRPHPRVILVQALAKGDRDELAVQAATELGVDAVVPWQASRSISRWDAAKAERGRARWAAIAREAAKQAHRAWIPEVEARCSTDELLERAQSSRTLVLEPGGDARLARLDLRDEARDILLVVGPEGGISPDELTALDEAGGQLVRLGESVLRTSTAGPAAIALVSASLGRW
jgi:16S rRNA (uracil1498-N3)-methyltransferase